VRADRETKAGYLEERLINHLWSALGVDPKTLPNHVTLGELGIESMLAVELQQTLEREYNLKLTIYQVKKITVKQMKDFQSGNKDEILKIAEDFKTAKANLAKIKFIIPNETHTKLNNVQKGIPIYVLPPVEGIFSTYEELAKKINRPVIGLNWTRDMDHLKNMKEISIYYMNLLKKLSPNDKYDIVGHSFGALIATQMFNKAPVGRLLIIDLISNKTVDKEFLSDEELFENVQNFTVQSIPETFRDRLEKDLNAIKDIDQKIKKVVIEIKEFGGKDLIGKDMEEIFKNSLERGKLLYSHRLKIKNKVNKFKMNAKKKLFKASGKLFIIKPHEGSDETNLIEKINESYNLQQMVCYSEKTKLFNISNYYRVWTKIRRLK
jgi:thioesterase domain-containing protein/acyl carrier protein